MAPHLTFHGKTLKSREIGGFTLKEIRHTAGVFIPKHFVHGYPKIVGGITVWRGLGGAFNRLIGLSFAPGFWGFLAMVAEFGGGLCLITGIFFRPACTAIFFTLFVATISIICAGYGFNSASQPIELAVVVAALFLMGPGKLTARYFLHANNKGERP